MKRSLLIVAALAITATMPSCEKALELLFQAFELPLNFNVTLSPSTVGDNKTLGSTVVSYDLDAKVKAETDDKFGADIVTKIYVTQLGITLSNTNADNNLSNFESVSLKVSSGTGGSIVLGPFMVPAGATTTMSMPITNSPNLRQYFNGDNVTFEVIGKTIKATTIQLPATISTTLKMDK